MVPISLYVFSSSHDSKIECSPRFCSNFVYNIHFSPVLQRIEELKDFYTLGPFGRFSYQMNFCTKLGSQNESVTPDKTTEWPVGTYAIFGISFCPRGIINLFVINALG